jgi:hypothetical protein
MEEGEGVGGRLDLQGAESFWQWHFDQLRHRIAGGFGHGGQDIHRYLGAR